MARAPHAIRPVVTLDHVYVDDGAAPWHVDVAVQDFRPASCSVPGGVPVDPEIGGGVTEVEAVLWECDESVLPEAPDHVAILQASVVVEDLSGNVEGRVQVFGVHIGLCPAERICVRLDETFRLRLPGELGDSYAELRVSYPWVGMTASPGGDAERVWSQDRLPDPAAGPPVVDLRWPGRDFDPVTLTYTLPWRILVDRPVTLRHVTLVPGLGAAPSCPERTYASSSTGVATDFTVDMRGICPRTSYRGHATMVDAAGVEHVVALASFSLPHLFGLVDTEVRLAGGPTASRWGYLYRFGANLDGQPGTGRDWLVDGVRWGIGPDCIYTDGTVIASSDDALVELEGGELTVSVLVHFTTTGDSDCVDTGARIGAVELRADVTLAQLAAGVVELRTPPGSPLDVAVTVTPSADGWRPVG